MKVTMYIFKLKVITIVSCFCKYSISVCRLAISLATLEREKQKNYNEWKMCLCLYKHARIAKLNSILELTCHSEGDPCS